MSIYFRVESQFLLNVIEIDLLILLSSYTSKSVINVLGKIGRNLFLKKFWFKCA